MQTDPFASIRKRDTGISTSFRAPTAHPEHAQKGGVFSDNPQKSALSHPEHPEHRQIGERPKTPTIESATGGRLLDFGDREYEAVPKEWRAGLIHLNIMPKPKMILPTRWRQIVLDAFRFAWTVAEDREPIGWSIGSLFGFDPSDDETPCLVLDIRGGWVTRPFKDHRGRDIAGITDGDRIRWHYRRQRDDAPPIWTLGSLSTGR